MNQGGRIICAKRDQQVWHNNMMSRAKNIAGCVNYSTGTTPFNHLPGFTHTEYILYNIDGNL